MRAAAGTVVAEVSVPQLRSNEKRFRGGLVFQARRLVVSRKTRPRVVTKKKKKGTVVAEGADVAAPGAPSYQGQIVFFSSLICHSAGRNPGACGTNQEKANLVLEVP